MQRLELEICVNSVSESLRPDVSLKIHRCADVGKNADPHYDLKHIFEDAIAKFFETEYRQHVASVIPQIDRVVREKADEIIRTRIELTNAYRSMEGAINN